MPATEWTACPDPDCGVPAAVVDRYSCDGSPGPVELVTTDCANGHHFYGVDSTRLHLL